MSSDSNRPRPRHRQRIAGVIVAVALASIVTGSPRPLSAGPKQSLDAAERLYFAGEYEEALLSLEELAQRTGTSHRVRVAALKYAAFCYLYLGAETQAREAWLRLLEIEPGFRLDPVEDSPIFVSLFNQVRVDREPDADPSPAPAPPRQARRPLNVVDPEPASAARGCGIALCLVPFGGGQLANDNILKGVIFAATETLFLALNIGLFQANQSEVAQNGGLRADQVNGRNTAQNVFFGLFLTSVAIGIADAFVFP